MSDKLIFKEIYGGKRAEWKGWHHVFLKNGNPEEDVCIIGPLDPASSERLIAATKPALPSDEEIDSKYVELLRSNYISALEKFLLSRGWKCTDDQWKDWSKGEYALLNYEEAFWRESDDETKQVG